MIKEIIPPAIIPISAPAQMYVSVSPQAYHIPDVSIPPATAPNILTAHRINGTERTDISTRPISPPMMWLFSPLILSLTVTPKSRPNRPKLITTSILKTRQP